MRSKVINLRPDRWDIIEVPWVDGHDIQRYFEQTDHHKYGWPSLITSQLFNLNRPVNGAQFCSEWCAAAMGLPNSSSYSPATLGVMCEWYIGRLETDT